MNMPLERAPRKDRPPLITRKGKHIEYLSPKCDMAIQFVRNGSQGELPILLPKAFVEDMAEWADTYHREQFGWMDDRSAINLQEDLADHWPIDWIIWVFVNIGYISYQGFKVR
jgi:hypothetical protein